MTQQVMLAREDVGARRVGAHRCGRQQKWTLDEPGRRLIEARYDGRTATIDELAERLRVPRWQVRKWGAQLGLARQKEPRWSEADLDYLERAVGRVGVAQIAQRLGRTRTAVKLKMKRLSLRATDDGYTMRGLCEGLGVDHHRVRKWLDAGWLRGTRRQTERVEVQGGDMWYFSDAAIRNLVREHPTEIDPRRCEWVWLVDILTS